ncbi:hypothetical protein LC605_30105 [Nostoc sp. CHAB 5836]|uniref:hypothetical protein n=1 Tax=Nostoc sp. CHAB 5836 TaxID=2780404 RepID=UPI001E586053|nr:hypothetical protein [Nostoc sp. CHAB 5836]MCC5619251.1 hypothetical protein [Nostoc sp. CHAB 5836]
MTVYCADKTKATILFERVDGTKGQLIINSPPVEIICLPANNQGKYIFTLATSGSNYDCSGDHSYRFGGDRIADSYQVGNLIPVSSSSQCPGRELTFYPSGQIDIIHPTQYRITQRDNPNYHPTEGIEVKDKTGKTIFKELGIKCNCIVNCEEDCSEGFCKCPSPTYPGYCCLDCASTAASIRAITNELRAKNG